MGLIDILLPAACASCGRFGAPLCRGCVSAFRPPSPETDRFVAPDAGCVAGADLALAVAAFAYEGGIRSALGRLKYAGTRNVAGPLARAAAPALARLLAVTGAAPLIPVPLYADREHERGYNQAAVLARELATVAGVPYLDALRRRRPTERQHRLDRAARLRNLAEAFECRNDVVLPPRAIVVDDILTTSATLEACARVLRAAGVGMVFGFAIAREV